MLQKRAYAAHATLISSSLTFFLGGEGGAAGGGAGILIPQGNAGRGFLLISRLVDEIARGWSRGGDGV